MLKPMNKICQWEVVENAVPEDTPLKVFYVSDGKYLVTTVTTIFKTFIPQEKQRNQREKALWNKGLIFTVYNPI